MGFKRRTRVVGNRAKAKPATAQIENAILLDPQTAHSTARRTATNMKRGRKRTGTASDSSGPQWHGKTLASPVISRSAANMTALESILHTYRTSARTEREKGTYFEHLIKCYFENEPSYRDLYSDVWTFSEWAKMEGHNAQDAGIDLVARTDTGELHAIQCKLYAPDYCLQKKDIDSFFTASGKKPFARRIIVSSTNRWSTHARDALVDQVPPVTKLDLHSLEASQIDWSAFATAQQVRLKARKQLRPHQESAVIGVKKGLQSADRGKLIMACGTGKTFTALKIAEGLAGRGKSVLFLVPSLSLLSQTLTEWTQECDVPIHSFAVCSDSDVGKKRSANEDLIPLLVHELRYPATTDAKALAREFRARHDAAHMSVVFSTYHSIEVLHQAQRKHDLPAFDLIICDEAHRTTGAIFEDQDESNFVKVHDAKYLRARKRLYMTATPRIYGDSAKAIAERDNVTLCSMDDPALFGEQLYLLTFSNAVTQRLLVDYKVVVLAVDETHINRKLQKLLSDEDNQLRVDDAAKIVGCWKALAKQGLTQDLVGDDHPMRRAVAFCQVIAPSHKAKGHKVSSKSIASMFQAVVEAYQELEDIEPEAQLDCEAEHIDGTMNASEKEAKLEWLKADTPANTCRILSNVRCLSEGVDVPALDAVLFLTPRNSQVDVVQSVGRVMRNAPGKKRGYVIIPVVIPAGLEPHEALNDNKTYSVVWQVLQALRSHDDRFDAMVNKMDLELNRNMLSKMEVVAVTDKIAPKARKTGGTAKALRSARGGRQIGAARAKARADGQHELPFEIGEIERAIYAKVVQKCGNRHHWEDWAKDIAQIARTHIDRISAILENEENTREREAFDRLADELRDDLNDSITRDEIVEMLAQHLVTKPVFDALFSGHNFATENSMSRAMQGVLDALEGHRLDKEASTLEAFYQSVKTRAEGVESAEGKQKIILELYDKFFRNAFPKMSERLGIVYTPVEIVDFILKSVDHLLRTEFDQTLSSKAVHILDPFTGTGTFITRLLQSGLIEKEALPRKYAKEIHANEIVLLAYYIAAINIEAAYHGIVGGKYQPYEGICLTDTFQLYEKDDLISRVLADNSARRTRQKKLDIRVIVGNPPYSVGQDRQNDNNQNVEYPRLDERIRETYAACSTAVLKTSLYDSYVRAIRWASDRVGTSGIVGFVTNASYIDGAADGLRKCLVDEFSDLYVFHLRGNQRTAGERSRREGGKVFGGGSRAPIAISLLVKNGPARKGGTIHFRDIGDYLSREQKLATVANFGSIEGITRANGWSLIEPDEHGDWLKQRDDTFSRHLILGAKRGSEPALFSAYSNGVKTQRDAWAYSPSKRGVESQMRQMIAFYESERRRFERPLKRHDKAARKSQVDDFIDTDPTKIAWTRALKKELAKGTPLGFEASRIVPSLYRPYLKQWLYFDRKLNEIVGQLPRLFPRAGVENRAIGVSSGETRSAFSALMTNVLPSLHATDMVGSQYFPLYVYGRARGNAGEGTLFARQGSAGDPEARQDGITDAGLAHFKAAYPKEEISKEDVFYYVYGILHSAEYRERYADNLGKELPRIPRLKQAGDFRAFSRAGRKLGDLHVGYESVPEHKLSVEGPARPTSAQYRVEKMRFGKGKDKTVIHYNDHITIRGVPIAAYEYVVNGKSAIEWVMDRQCVTTDKASRIVKDANDWATETAGDPRYPLSLLLRVITVSLETIKIVRALPALELLD